MTSQYDLQWTHRFDRQCTGPEGGTRHLLVTVRATEADRPAPADRAPLDLAVVIDASGSMRGEPFTAALTATRTVIDRLGERDTISLVTFATNAVTHATRIRCDAAGRTHAHDVVNRLRAGGTTDLSGGWFAGCEAVSGGTEPGDGIQHRVLVLSDGYANRGITQARTLAHHAAQLRQRGVYTSAVGIGNNYSPTQLEALVESGGGRLHDAPLGADILAVVAGELGEILTTAADDLTLAVRHGGGLGVTVLGPYRATPGFGTTTVALGTLVAGSSRDVVLQVAVPRGSVGQRFELTLEPSWRAADTGQTVHAAVLAAPITLVTADEVAREPIDQVIGERVANLWLQALKMESARLNSDGRCEEARRLIEEAMPAFREYCRELPGAQRLGRSLDVQMAAVAQPMEDREVRAMYSVMRTQMKSERRFTT